MAQADLTAGDLMQTTVRSVSADMSLVDLERSFLDDRVSGYPVVDGRRLVGIVSRSDVVRHLQVEQTRAELVSDYYRDLEGSQRGAHGDLGEIAARVGKRLENLRVGDVMIRDLITVRAETPLREVAKILIDRHVHRVLVVDDEGLAGIITSLDLVRLLADDLS